MKELSNYIYEKLDINKVKLNDKFPTDRTLNDIIEFLKEEGFKQVEYDYVKTVFNRANTKCFMIDDASIRFADTSKEDISKDNPVFYIGFYNKIVDYSVFYCDNGLITDIVENDKKEFLIELNKRFGWK